MTHRAACLVALLAAGLLLGQPPKDPPGKDGGPVPVRNDPTPVVRLAAQAKPSYRALEWSLRYDELDRLPGNAAPAWLRAGAKAREGKFQWTEARDRWLSAGPEGVTLKNLPQKDVQAALDTQAAALRLVEQAARRARCDWELPPVTMQTFNDLPLDEVQAMRELIRLVSLRCRLHQAQGRFDEAVKDLRAGLAMARHVGESDMMIHQLVGLAIGAIMLGRVEEWVQQKGSPNLYWALTDLPSPLVDSRRGIRNELNTIHRSFPMLRELKEKKLTPAEAQAKAEKVIVAFQQYTGQEMPGWFNKLGTAAATLKYHPVAKKGLIERGRSKQEVEAMPAIQAVALYYLEEYDRARDEFRKLLALPPWQCFPALQRADRAERARAKNTANVLLSLLSPALVKVYYAQIRTERQVAGLRAAEALRMHVGKHGKPPAKWADITEVPLPVDPFTGKGFDEWYSIKDGKAVLDVPPPPGMTAILGRRYEVLLKES